MGLNKFNIYNYHHKYMNGIFWPWAGKDLYEAMLSGTFFGTRLRSFAFHDSQ